MGIWVVSLFFGYYEHWCCGQFSIQVFAGIYFQFSGCVYRSRTSGSYSPSVFNLLRNCGIVSHSGCAMPHSHQHCSGLAGPCPHLLMDYIDANWSWSCIWFLIFFSYVVLICISLMTNLGRSPGRGHGNPLQYSCLENPHGRRSLAGYSPWCCKESDMTEAT